MKVFFDTNVYVAEALRGPGAARMIEATRAARWRIYFSSYVLDELTKVLTEDIQLSPKLAGLALERISKRSILVAATASATVPEDAKDTPVLRAALTCAADYLVSNDHHLLALDPYHGLRIVSMDSYFQILRNEGLLK
jgi:putative PIN family toxin of toxin-antitoxin system